MTSKMHFGGGGPGLGGLLKDGYKHFSGVDDATLKNVEAASALAGITKTSLGPNGMNKLVINHLEKVFVTSDAATITAELEIAHPAAKMLAMAAEQQDKEIGDGTNFALCFAGELLEKAGELIRLGVHTADIITGYEKAAERAQVLLEEAVVSSVEDVRDLDQLTAPLKPVIGAKTSGLEGMLAPLVAKACQIAFPPVTRKPALNVDNVRTAKLLGMTLDDSAVVKGMVIRRDSESHVKHVQNAVVAVYGCPIEAGSTETKGTVVLKDAAELLNYTKGEEKMMEEAISSIAAAGVNVIVSGGSISEVALHFIDKYNMLCLKIVSKFELRRLCRAVGATAMARLGPPTAGELGAAAKVSVEELSGAKVTVIQQKEDEDTHLATVVLRGATQHQLDELERAVNDAVCVVKVLCKDGRLVPGAGATEIALSMKLQEEAATWPGLEQYAGAKFGEAFEVIPRSLAENSGLVASEVVARLRQAHAEGGKHHGVDVDGGKTVDAVETGILDSFAVKQSAIQLAVDAALAVLRVDHILMAKQAGGPKPQQPGAPDED